ncbi:SRPBCC family protein [Rhizosaccharibacter radicis]|uniref:SRPBCC family protein n=1 Tax=Rhizosaccharibacter radicis TaxID=2782605 RepID=A0ABT1W0H0_9PROT|nr:SRPBCC family protein [Acetobacteraceae bacterium KSS12]
MSGSIQASTPQAKAILTMQQDLGRRSPDIHWAPGFDPATADLFAHNELLINAPCEKVFARIVDAKAWPSWYANSSRIHMLGGASTLGSHTRFRWTTFGLDIESEVHGFEPGRRIGWYGYVPGQPPAFYHTWLLKPVDGGCMTVMEEVGRGDAAAHLRDTDQSLMHRGHDLWLATLRWMSESVGG